MASTLHPVASLPKKSFRRVVIFAKKAFSIRRWFSSAELAQLQRYSMEQAYRWGKFGQLPKDQSIPFCANFAQELAAAYGGDSEWERDAACWASEMAKWESAVKNPEYQLHRSHKDVEELFEGMFSRIFHCQELGAFDDPVKFWSSVARKRLEDAKKFSSLAKVEPDKAKKQALSENAKEAEAEAKEAKAEAKTAMKKATIFTLRWFGIPGLILGILLGFSSRLRIKLFRLCGTLSEQEAEFAMIVESNDGVPAVLTNFRGCRKSTVCTNYHSHQKHIGRRCVLIADNPQKTESLRGRAITVMGPDVLNIVYPFGLSVVTAAIHFVCRHPLLIVPTSMLVGSFFPAHWKPGVVIFDDITSVTMYRATAGEKKGAADDKPKLAEYTNIPGVVGAAYKGKTYGRGKWIQVVVSSNEGIRLLQRDMNTSKYGYESFPTPSAEELRGAIKAYIKEKLRESKKAGTRTKSDLKASEEDFPPPTVDEIERAVELYGEWWGGSIRFWILPFNNNDAGFYKRMRSAQLTADEIGKLAAELDLMCSSGPAPLIGSPPIDVSEFNEAFALIKGKGPLEDAVRGLYGNKMYVDVHHFPRRLLHSVMYSLVTTRPVANFAETLEVKLAEVTKRNAVPLTPFRWDLSDVLLTPLRRGWLGRTKKLFVEWLTGKGNPSLSEGRDKPHQTERQEKKGTQDH